VYGVKQVAEIMLPDSLMPLGESAGVGKPAVNTGLGNGGGLEFWRFMIAVAAFTGCWTALGNEDILQLTSYATSDRIRFECPIVLNVSVTN
jgi:hypothetical protein